MTKIVVHGVHRSGTSFWASLLEKAGCWYSEDEYAMLPQKDNPKGFWERTDVVELNDRVLAELGLNWFTLKPSIQKQRFNELKSTFEEEVAKVVSRIDKHDDWFIKDPRLSITWALWADHLEPTHHLVIHRHPISVAKSLNRRDGVSIRHGLIFWYHQTRMIAKSLASEDDVVNVEFNSKNQVADYCHSVLNDLFKDSKNFKKLELKDIQTIFDLKLINHQSIKEESLDKEALEVYQVVSKAWDYAINGEFQKLLNLPEFETADFSWDELDTSYAANIQNQKSQREITQYQDEIQNYSNRIIEFSNKFDLKRDRLNSHIKSLDKELVNKGKDIRLIKEEVRLNKEEVRLNKEELRLIEEEILKVESELALRDQKSKLQQDTIDELNNSLLSIAGLLKSYMNSKRYFVFNGFNKVMAKVKLLKHRSLHDALDIAKFGHSSSDLEGVMPKASTQLLLLKTIAKNPREFLRRMNAQRFKKGLKVVLGKGETDLATQQALLQYHCSDISNNAELDVFDPEDIKSWLDESLMFHSEANPKVSIVIPVYNNYSTTLACLHSIKKHTDNKIVSYEIIIADDCSTDETRNIDINIKGLNVVRPDKNLGFLQNCNHAMQTVKGEFIVLLNNDTNVQKDWLPELLNPLKEDPSVGITGPMFVYPDGRLQEAGGIIFSDASGWNYGRFDQPDKPEYNFARDVDYISGACLVFRRSLWDQVGGFDEVFIPAYYEDTDFCFQVRKLEMLIRYVPTAKVIHFEGVSHGSDEDSGVKQYQVVNRENFLNKWKTTLNSDHYGSPDDLFLAREHGKKQKVLLYIDHYVPFHDQDTGSKLTKGYIDLMTKENIRVIFLGANFYPHEPYTSELQESGVEVLYGKYYQDNWLSWLEQHIKHIDAIYFNRPHITAEFIDKIKALKHCPNLAYNPIDLHYLRVARQESLGVTGENGGYTSAQWKSIEFDLMRKCDVSFYFSDAEIEAIKLEDPTINAQKIAMYWFDQEVLNKPIHLIQEPNLLFVGGFGHPPNKDGLEWFLEEIFPQVLDKNPDVKLTVIGSKCPKDVFNLENDNIRILGQVSEEVLDQEYKKARISIVPLRYGAGVKGKVIESMKYRVNVITTSIGSEGLPGDPSQYLSVLDEADDFASNLSLLLSDDDLCKAKQKHINRALEEHFSVQAAKRILPMIGV